MLGSVSVWLACWALDARRQPCSAPCCQCPAVGLEHRRCLGQCDGGMKGKAAVCSLQGLRAPCLEFTASFCSPTSLLSVFLALGLAWQLPQALGSGDSTWECTLHRAEDLMYMLRLRPRPSSPLYWAQPSVQGWPRGNAGPQAVLAVWVAALRSLGLDLRPCLLPALCWCWTIMIGLWSAVPLLVFLVDCRPLQYLFLLL